jgi:hypothetical protein
MIPTSIGQDIALRRDYIIRDYYTTIYIYRGLINIQIDHKIFNSIELDNLFRNKIYNPEYFKNKTLAEKEEEVLKDSIDIVKNLTRENIIWENFPVDINRTNYTLEIIIDGVEEHMYIRKYDSNDEPLEFKLNY